jgi:peptide/nickel transport system substrate-binding protein
MYKILIVITLLLFAASNLPAQNEYNVRGTKQVYSWGPIYGEEHRMSSIMIDLMFLRLLTTDDRGKVQPVILAKDPVRNVIEGNKGMVSLELRDDITWQNGDPVTIYDVEFTWKAILASNVNVAKEKVSRIIEMHTNTGSDTKMNVIFESDSEDNLGALTFYLLPKKLLSDSSKSNPHKIEPDHEFFTSKPIGNGKFKAVKNSISETGGTLHRNDKFYLPEVTNNILEYFYWNKSDDYKLILTEVINGNSNFVLDVPVSQYTEFKKQIDKGELVEKPLDSVQMMAFNLRRPAFQDSCLRLLFQYAINKQTCNENYLQGKAVLLTGPFPTTSAKYYYRGYTEPRLYDSESIDDKITEFGYSKARGKLQKNNADVGPFELYYNSDTPNDEDIARYIESTIAEELGVKIKIIAAKDFRERIYNTRDFDLVLVDFSFGSDPNVYTLFHSSHNKPGGFNFSGLNDKDVDLLLEDGRNASGNTKVEIYNKQHELLGNLLPAIFLFQKPFAVYADRQFKVTSDNLDCNYIFKYIEEW